jgi:hypothetical protein
MPPPSSTPIYTSSLLPPTSSLLPPTYKEPIFRVSASEFPISYEASPHLIQASPGVEDMWKVTNGILDEEDEAPGNWTRPVSQPSIGIKRGLSPYS